MTNLITASATRLRVSLVIALVLTMAVVVGVVIYGIGWLNRYATDVSAVAVEAQVSEGRLDTMRHEATRLQNFSEAADRAQRIAADSKDYAHQDVIIRDLERFANRAGIRILSYDFTSANATAATGANPRPTQASRGLKSTTVNIVIDDPVNYVNLLRFIHYVEQNLTKMQISNITLNSTSNEGNMVSSGGLSIEVYIR